MGKEAERRSSWLPTATRIFNVTAGFLAVCSLMDMANAAVTEAQKAQMKEALGEYFGQCMEIGKEFAFCLLAQKYAVQPKPGEHFNCNGDTSMAALMERRGFMGDRAACEAANTPQGDSYTQTCMKLPSGQQFCTRN